MPNHLRKVLGFFGVGAAWLFFLAIPLRGRPIFYHVSDNLVPSGLAQAIGNQVEIAWYKSKSVVRSALNDAEEEKQRQF